jgi:transposase
LSQKKRQKRLYKAIPKGSHVICFDEFGPLELRPQYGSHWAKQGHPQRLPATYTRKHGVRHFLAFYDLRHDRVWGYFFQRKRGLETIRALERLRKMYPRKHTIYLILDNFSPHKHKTVRQWAKNNNIVFVWTPTNASWLNRIECQFTEMKKYSLDNTFFKTHAELQHSIKKFLRYRNSRNKKKRIHYLNLLKRH